MSEAELQTLCRRIGVPSIILTLGERGCFVSTEKKYQLLPAKTGITVVDTTGAGDAFVGGFAAGLEEANGNIFRAAEFGNTVAAICVSKHGTAQSMPTRDEIFALF